MSNFFGGVFVPGLLFAERDLGFCGKGGAEKLPNALALARGLAGAGVARRTSLQVHPGSGRLRQVE